MNQTSVLIASILKPVDDPRMFEKFGNSLAQTNKYEVNIIGFEAKKYKKIENISLYPVFNFKRLSLKRLLAPLIYLRILLKVKPEIIIVNTPEILAFTILYKLFLNGKIIYDIQENYFRNIIYNKNYLWGVKHLFGVLIRLKELISYPFIDQVLYSDQGYQKEMPFWNNKSTLIRNTYIDPQTEFDQTKKFPGGRIELLYSGTIAENYGIFEVISFVDSLHQVNPDISLIVIGYSANQLTRARLFEKTKDKSHIQLIGINKPVSHGLIIEAIRKADFGIINYKINPSTANCFPTKIYEYMANELPIIIQNYPPWSSFCLKYDAGMVLDFSHVEYEKVNNQILNTKFYRNGIPDIIFWRNDEKKLLNNVQNTLI